MSLTRKIHRGGMKTNVKKGKGHYTNGGKSMKTKGKKGHYTKGGMKTKSKKRGKKFIKGGTRWYYALQDKLLPKVKKNLISFKSALFKEKDMEDQFAQYGLYNDTFINK